MPAAVPAQAPVSVIIPAYNAERTLARAIESALMQTLPPQEILVVDDGSHDRTPDIALGFGAPVRLLRKSNGGPASARNLGAHGARAAWLGFLDADDWWLPEKLERQMALAGDPDIAVLHCLIVDDQITVPFELGFAELWRENLLGTSALVIRRDLFEAMGGFDECPDLVSVEDYHLWLRVAASGARIVTLQERLVHYTRGAGISWDQDRFLRASLRNVDMLAATLSLHKRDVAAKRTDIYRGLGRQALYRRDLPRARRLLAKAAAERPDARTMLSLAAACLPRALLDARRALINWRG